MAKETRGRLDQPVGARRMRFIPAPMNLDEFGKFSEKIARFLGTGRYLFLQSFIVIAWVLCNTIPALRFDKYPYLFLTLALSLQASYAAPLILLAQNRQADRDRVALEEDREQYARNLADTEYLTRELASMRIAMGDIVTRDFLRSELRNLLEDLADEREGKEPKDKKHKKKDKHAAESATAAAAPEAVTPASTEAGANGEAAAAPVIEQAPPAPLEMPTLDA